MTWQPASACRPPASLPFVAGTAPSFWRLAPDGLRAYWPASAIEHLSPTTWRRYTIIATFRADGAAWRLCAWDGYLEERHECREEAC